MPVTHGGWSDTKVATNPCFIGAVLYIACKLLMEPFIGRPPVKEN